MTAALMTKGTWTRSATQIAEQTEFFGSGINGRATWNSTIIGFDSTTDKLNQVMSVFADVVLRPTFPEKEIALYKSQTLDELKQRLAQPGFM
jgi:zinc protease